MKNNINKEKWIDEVFNSTQGLKRAQPGADLYEKIAAKLSHPQPVSLPFPVKRWIAAAVLLLAVNMGSVIYFNGQEKKTVPVNTGNPLASEIQTETTYNY